MLFVGSPDDEVEKAEGFIGEVGGGGFFGSPDDEVEKAEGFTGEVRGGFFLVSLIFLDDFLGICVMAHCALELGGYEGQFIFIFAQKVT